MCVRLIRIGANRVFGGLSAYPRYQVKRKPWPCVRNANNRINIPEKAVNGSRVNQAVCTAVVGLLRTQLDRDGAR